ncbi:MAG: HAMP domain-containing histidine kinase [Spirochaetes bacterium]|nr:HAMP domain-containing histidine kinase [Spirochaetota bacterium]
MMKIKKLYIKIFFAFVFLLIVSGILILGVFHSVFEKQTDPEANNQLKKYFEETVFLFRDIVEEKINSYPDLPVSRNTDLQKIIKKISKKYDLLIWMEIPGTGKVNFTAEEIPEIKEEGVINSGNFFYKVHMGKKGSVYIRIPVRFNDGRKGDLFVFHKREPVFHSLPFVRGLLIIGIFLAILLYPFSRFITQPLKRLTNSVDTFAKGDLSHRVRVKSGDEIGRLSESFNKMAAKIESMIMGTKEMTANISHELRSPLARMRIAQEMLSGKLDSKDESIKKYLKSIENEIQEMDILLGRVLNLTKLDIKEKAEKEKVDLGNLIKEITSSYSSVFEKKKISITFNFKNDLLMLDAVKEDIKTVFTNIFDNASRYTETGGRINVEAEKTNTNIRIAVFNTCENLDDNELVNIFRPFYRSSTDSSTPGYGLGLAITKKILDNCGGSIELQNTDEGLSVETVIPVS